MDSFDRLISFAEMNETENNNAPSHYHFLAYHFDSTSADMIGRRWFDVNTHVIKDDFKRWLRQWPIIYKYIRWGKIGVQDPHLGWNKFMEKTKNFLRKSPVWFMIFKKIHNNSCVRRNK